MGINAYNSKRYMDRETGQMWVWNTEDQVWETEGDPGIPIQLWPLVDVLDQGASAGGHVIEDVGDPLNLQDAATKAYVDAQIAAMFELFSSVSGAAASDFLFETLGTGEGDGIGGNSNVVLFGWLTDAAGTA